MNAWRLVAGLLALTAFVVAVFALVVPWWVLIAPSSGSFSFFLGGTLQVLIFSSFERISIPYASVAMTWIQLLYAWLLALVLASLVIALIAGVLAVLSSIGRIRPAPWTKTLRTLLVLALVLIAAATIAGAFAQPAAFAHEKTSALNVCTVDAGGKTPCTTFWGFWDSVNNSGTLYSWGPSTGWFLAAASAGLLLVALFCWWRGGPRPVRAAPPVPASAAAPAMAPPSEGASSAPPPP